MLCLLWGEGGGVITLCHEESAVACCRWDHGWTSAGTGFGHVGKVFRAVRGK